MFLEHWNQKTSTGYQSLSRLRMSTTRWMMTQRPRLLTGQLSGKPAFLKRHQAQYLLSTDRSQTRDKAKTTQFFWKIPFWSAKSFLKRKGLSHSWLKFYTRAALPSWCSLIFCSDQPHSPTQSFCFPVSRCYVYVVTDLPPRGLLLVRFVSLYSFKTNQLKLRTLIDEIMMMIISFAQCSSCKYCYAGVLSGLPTASRWSPTHWTIDSWNLGSEFVIVRSRT